MPIGVNMTDLIIKNDNFIDVNLKSRKEYNEFIKFNLKYADQIIFTVDYVSNQYEKLSVDVKNQVDLEIIDSGYVRAASDMKGENSYLIEVKNNYNLYEYLINCENIFDFEEENDMRDMCFLKSGEVYCYTITHEKVCIISEEERIIFEKQKKT